MKTKPSLRVWPGAAGAILIVTGFFLQAIVPGAALVGILGVVTGSLAVTIGWLFASRAPWPERIGAVALAIAAWAAMRPFLDESIIGGAMGAMPVLAFPVLGAALGFWAWGTQRLRNPARHTTLVAALLTASIFCTLVRTDGIGPRLFEFQWRWTPTPEERLLALETEEPGTAPPESVMPAIMDTTDEKAEPAPAPDTPPPMEETVDWPGFRGLNRNGVVHDVRIRTDWSAFPPVELWRRPIGPGWSSFAVDGGRFYTQEQRGDDEVVAAYDLATGEPVWMHRDSTRFWESNGGAGPRGTPALHVGRVFAFGATGLLNALDTDTGRALWQRNVAADTGTPVPDWGFSSSPLVVDSVVIVAAGGQLAGYGVETGSLLWTGPEGGFSYSSPHFLTIDDVDQVLLLGANGATSVAPADGEVLWRHLWDGGAIVQPAVIADGDIVINAITFTGGTGTRRLSVTAESGEWNVEEVWTSRGLKPYFNDFVLNDGHAFGFDGSILASIDLESGERNWKGGRYGSGQLMLLADQDVLLVISEEGELALVGATPDQFTEIARMRAIEGKTWNHPVLVGDTLLVRNGEEMAAFRLSLSPG